MISRAAIRFSLLAAALLAAPSAQAASFYIQEQSTSGLGTAFAGAVADTPDASTIFYNPAGMADLDRAQFAGGAAFLLPNANFKNTGSTVSSLPGTGGATVALQGTGSDNPFNPAAVPSAYVALPLNKAKNWWGGIGVSAPFGLANKYDKDFVGRYDSMENKLTVMDIAPSLAWAPNKFVSLGFGLDIQHADAMLKTALPSPITSGGPIPGTDGSTDLSGDSWNAGLNAGIIFKPMDGTRIGAHYRQGVSHDLEGRLIRRIPLDVPGVGGTYARITGGAELDLPGIASVAISQKVTDRLTLLGSANHYEWSNFNDIPVHLDNATSSQSFQNYEDTWGFALGARYKLRDDLTLKAGIQYDQSPTVNNFRSTRIPDGNRTWLAAGASYDIDNAWSLDFAAAYVHVSQETINQRGTVPIGAASTTFNIRGETDGSVGIAAATLRYKFDTPY